jgi:nitronate monooxygenase
MPSELSTPFTQRFQLGAPIALAAMDLVSDAALTSAVSRAGGLGLLGGGYGDEAWLRRELALLEREREAGGLGAAGFGVGFITWSLARQPQLLDITLQARPSALWLSFGDPAPFIERAHARDVPVICQVQTVAMAEDAVAKGADVVVAQGSEAGGHGSARGTFALVPAVCDAVGHRAIVLAAGGVADGRGLAAALMLGASGVALGTRLYASEEAAGHVRAKQRLVEAHGDETMRSVVFDISRRNVWPAPFTGRCLVNEHLQRWSGREIELLRALPTEAERYATARAEGNFDIAAVIAGESVDLVHSIEPAHTIIERMVAEAGSLLRRGAGAS